MVRSDLTLLDRSNLNYHTSSFLLTQLVVVFLCDIQLAAAESSTVLGLKFLPTALEKRRAKVVWTRHRVIEERSQADM
ncbi:MAG: hypothetical protein AABM64_04195 [Pseudomonadota bacterium]